MHDFSFDFLRRQIVGIDSAFDTPFGRRLMVYCDYTASGRCLIFFERYLQTLQRIYANTHTEDDLTGRSMSRLLHEAEHTIKRAVNAGPSGRIVACGTGATGAIDKLQQILGVYLPPATRKAVGDELREFLGAEQFEAFVRFQQSHQPVVFVGPYEHHSNEVTWRQGLATVVEVNLAADGGVDLAHLAKLLEAPEYRDRLRIGSFSAASNVTGMRTEVQEIARLLHAHGAYACFDFAASAPYVEIDMNPPARPGDGDASLDAVFISPHKFLGGPGSSGVLVFNERLYNRELPPSVGGGGTVAYVSPDDQDFIADIEERERAGTPGVLQTLKAALALELKSRIGVERIEAREQELIGRALDALVRARAHRAARQPRSAPAHRHRLVQPARSARPLPAPEVRHGAAERPVRDPVARRLFVRGPVRSPAARHRPADLGAVPRLGAQGLPGHQARLVPRGVPLRDGRPRGRVRHGRGGVHRGAGVPVPAAVPVRHRHRHVEPSRVSRDACRIFARCRPRGGRLRRDCAAGGDTLAELCRVPGRGALLGRAAR